MNIPAALREQAVCLGAIEPASSLPPVPDDVILRCLRSPLWPGDETRSLFDVAAPGKRTCIVVSDHTRRTAADRVLPAILRELDRKGCAAQDVFLLVASGIHRHPTSDELATLLGADLHRSLEGRILFHDPDNDADLVTVGTGSRGHAVRVNRHAVEAGCLVLLGAASYHYHAGFGGGRKSLVPGLAARETIAHNHRLSLHPSEDRMHPRADAGLLDGNPVSEEMFEGASMCEPDMTVTTVVDPSGALVGVFAGDMDMAHRAACGVVEQTCRVDLAETADLVLASAAGAPNWIQAHKALYNASRAVKPEGRIVLHAPCPEGIGNERFRFWMRESDEREMWARLRRSAEVNGQTALSTKTRGRRTVLVTDMNEEDIRDLGIAAEKSLDDAVTRALSDLAAAGIQRPTFYLMPHARHTVPFAAWRRDDSPRENT